MIQMSFLLLLLTVLGAGVRCSLIASNAPMSANDPSSILLSSDVRVYQSELHQSITITGCGFGSDLSLQTYPPLTVKEDYVLTVTSPTSATLYLVPTRQWRDAAGPLLVQSVKSGGVEYKLSDVRIATVLENPRIFYATVTTTDSKLGVFTIHGLGFTDIRLTNLSFSAANKTATLCATSIINSYVLLAEPCNQHPIEGAWDTAVDMRITAIDTGAGAVPTNVPVAVVLVTADKLEIGGGERSGNSIPYEDDYYSSGENADDQHYFFGSDSEDLPLTSYIAENLKSAASKPPVQSRRALQSLGSAAGSGDISVMLTVHEVSSLFLLLLVMLCAALLLVRCCQKTRHLNKLKSTSSEDLIV